MLLRRGITGFYKWDDRHDMPEFTFAEFKRIAFAVAAEQRLVVSQLIEGRVTPNFHSVQLDNSEISIRMIGHSTYPLIAFAEPANTDATPMRFVDCPPIGNTIQNLFPVVTIAATHELTRGLTDSDTVLLDVVEREQIEYWKPITIGDVVFNWWD